MAVSLALLTQFTEVSRRGACAALRRSCPTLAVLLHADGGLVVSVAAQQEGLEALSGATPSVVVAAISQGCVGLPDLPGKGGVYH